MNGVFVWLWTCGAKPLCLFDSIVSLRGCRNLYTFLDFLVLRMTWKGLLRLQRRIILSGSHQKDSGSPSLNWVPSENKQGHSNVHTWASLGSDCQATISELQGTPMQFHARRWTACWFRIPTKTLQCSYARKNSPSAAAPRPLCTRVWRLRARVHSLTITASSKHRLLGKLSACLQVMKKLRPGPARQWVEDSKSLLQ